MTRQFLNRHRPSATHRKMGAERVMHAVLVKLGVACPLVAFGGDREELPTTDATF